MPLSVVKTKFGQYLLKGLIIALFGLFVLTPSFVHAEPYGTGSYGECEYGQDCPTTPASGGNNSTGSGSNTGTTTPDSTDDTKILLNDFNEYFSIGGKQLVLKEKQIIYFDVNENGKTESHYLTIVTVGSDFVEFSFDGSSEVQKLSVGNKEQYDVTKNGQDEIEITLNSIDGDQATMTFKQIGTTTPSNTKTPEAKTTESGKSSGFNWTLPFFGLLFLSGLVWLIILFLKKLKSTNL
jgi:hypothetical protein